MSLRICTSEHMVSDHHGLRYRSSWYPDIVAEDMVEKQRVKS